MADFTVTTHLDIVNAGDGVTSLREAVIAANVSAEDDAITFANGLSGQTLVLTGGDLGVGNGSIAVNGDINGDKKADVTISGNDASGIFSVYGSYDFGGYGPGSANLSLQSLTLTDAGGVAVSASSGLMAFCGVSIADTTIRDGSETAVVVSSFEVGSVYIVNSLITGNSTTSNGGGIAVYSGAGLGFLTLVNSTVAGNSANGSGGGINGNGTVSLLNSTVTGNRSDADGNGTGTGGGISGYDVNIANSVVADNFVGLGSSKNDADSPIASATNSVFGTNVTIDAGSGNQTNIANVGLGQLLDNGGSVLTRSPLDGSILIGAGSNSAIPNDSSDLDGDGNTAEPLPLDGRRGLRLVGGTVDVGAVEQIVNETIRGTAGGDVIIGGLGIDSLSGLGGNDVLKGGAGNDTVAGGLGVDTLDLTDATGGVTIGFSPVAFAGSQSGGGLGNDTFTGIERILGSGFGDTFGGSNGGEVLIGNGGGDRIGGAGGGDSITGNGGDDLLIDGTGTDYVSGGSGDDAIALAADGVTDTAAGDVGIDALDLFYATGATTVVFGATLFAGTASGGGLGTNSFTGIERILGGNFGDTVTGGAGAEFFLGRAGADILSGWGGNDTLRGDAGADRLAGVQGADTVFGGADADTFVFGHVAHGGDTFGDFATGIDEIEIARAGFGLAAGYVVNFQVGAAAVGAGQVFLFNPATKQFSFDSNGAAAGGSVLLTTLTVGSVAAGDIVLV